MCFLCNTNQQPKKVPSHYL